MNTTTATPLTNMQQAQHAVIRAGILSAELYDHLQPFCSQPTRNPSVSQVAAYLALAEQMHRRSGKVIAALAALQAQMFVEANDEEIDGE